MKAKYLVLASLTALLAACGGGSTGGTPPTPPSQPSYPYNPDASTVQSSDSRVPYYGDWVWVVVFSDNTDQAGVMSITAKGNASATVFNAGVGAATVCAPDGSSCSDNGDSGVLATVLSEGQPYLSAVQFTASGKTARWLGVDDDGKVGTDSKGRPALVGSEAVWGDPGSPSARNAAFVMVQVSSTASAQSASLALDDKLSAQLGRLPTATLSAQRMNDLQSRALALASALADKR